MASRALSSESASSFSPSSGFVASEKEREKLGFPTNKKEEQAKREISQPFFFFFVFLGFADCWAAKIENGPGLSNWAGSWPIPVWTIFWDNYGIHPKLVMGIHFCPCIKRTIIEYSTVVYIYIICYKG